MDSVFVGLQTWAMSVPDDLWSSDELWHLLEYFPDWWKVKAWCHGFICFAIITATHNVSLWTRAARYVAAMGSLMIFATLGNQALGPFGDLVFAVGFSAAVARWAYMGMRERHMEMRALKAGGFRPMTPERAAYLLVTGQLSKVRSEGCGKAESDP